MEKTIFDVYSQDEIEDIIEGIMLMIDDKYKDKEILEEVDNEFALEFLSIAKARLKSDKDSGKFVGEARYFNLDDLRFTTPENVADYRASRLKCKIIVDLCSGIGVQSAGFAKTCSQVYSFEIDSRKVRYAKENFKDFSNLKFEVGDVMDERVIEKVKKIKPDIIFCDPERLASETERNIDSIKPDLKKLIDVYSKICPNLCFEIPPQVDIEKLRILGDFEAEYLSIDNKLNRLNLYFGELKKDDVSVVDVIFFDKISSLDKSKENSKFLAKSVRSPLNYLYEISSAVLKAGLENEFASIIDVYLLKGCEKGKLLLTSDEIHNDKLKSLLNVYEVIGIVRRLEDVSKILKQRGFGKVVLKYSVPPKEYWRERNKIENRLHGKKEAVLFLVDRKYVVCRKIE